MWDPGIKSVPKPAMLFPVMGTWRLRHRIKGNTGTPPPTEQYSTWHHLLSKQAFPPLQAKVPSTEDVYEAEYY